MNDAPALPQCRLTRKKKNLHNLQQHDLNVINKMYEGRKKKDCFDYL